MTQLNAPSIQVNIQRFSMEEVAEGHGAAGTQGGGGTTAATTTVRITTTFSQVEQNLSDLGFVLKEQLGKGAYAVVRRCIGPKGMVYAAKLVDLRPLRLKKRFDLQRLLREVEILRSM